MALLTTSAAVDTSSDPTHGRDKTGSHGRVTGHRPWLETLATPATISSYRAELSPASRGSGGSHGRLIERSRFRGTGATHAISVHGPSTKTQLRDRAPIANASGVTLTPSLSRGAGNDLNRTSPTVPPRSNPKLKRGSRSTKVTNGKAGGRMHSADRVNPYDHLSYHHPCHRDTTPRISASYT